MINNYCLQPTKYMKSSKETFKYLVTWMLRGMIILLLEGCVSDPIYPYRDAQKTKSGLEYEEFTLSKALPRKRILNGKLIVYDSASNTVMYSVYKNNKLISNRLERLNVQGANAIISASDTSFTLKWTESRCATKGITHPEQWFLSCDLLAKFCKFAEFEDSGRVNNGITTLCSMGRTFDQ